MGSGVPFLTGSIAKAQRNEPYTHNQLGYNAAIQPEPSSAARLKRSMVQRLTQRKESGPARRSSFTLNRASTSLSARLSGAFVAEKLTSVIPECLRPGRKQQQDQTLGPRCFSFVSSPPPRPPPVAPEQQALSSSRPTKRSLSSSDPVTDDPASLGFPTTAKRAKKSSQDLQQVPTAYSPPIPRLSPVLNGIALSERADWLRDHPERTTALDAAVQSPALFKDKPTPDELTPPGVPAFVVNPSLTFESILRSEPLAGTSLGPMHALGLKPKGMAVNNGTGSQVRRRPLPANYQGKQQFAVMPAGPVPNNSKQVPSAVPGIRHHDGRSASPSEPPAYTGKPVQVPVVDGLAGLPSVIRRKECHVASGEPVPSANAVVSSSSDLTPTTYPLLAARRKNAYRQSMRNELHFEYTARPRSFRIPLDPPEGHPGHAGVPNGLAPAESTQPKRLSNGFLQAGPNLSEAAAQILEQVRANPPRVDSVRARINAIESGCDDNKAKPMSPISADISLFDSTSFPFLDVAAKALDAGKETLRGPLPPGYTSHNGGPPTVNRSAIGDFGWQRFSDQEYVDPAVEDFRLNRRKRLHKRKQDLAAWDAAAAAAAPPPGPLGVKSTSEGTASELDSAVQVNGDGAHTSYEIVSAELTPSSAQLLDMIDFTDRSDLSGPKSEHSSLLDDLIQF